MTGRSALFQEWRFWDQEDEREGRATAISVLNALPGASGRLVARGRRGRELLLLVDGMRVSVPMSDDVVVKFIGMWDGAPLVGVLPDGLAAAHPELARVVGELRYDEKFLLAEQVVELRAWVEPVMHAGGAYRSAEPQCDFVVRPDLGDVELIERG